MPKLASSKKRMRQAEKARLRNKGTRSSLRTSLKKILETNSKEEAEALINRTQSIIDKTAQKGVIHRNAAARYKSRVRRHVAALES
ncbi:MAG: 30S ribosomal protein S20 [Gemmatimonadetes bacterium]|nr:30S ribosomal protein S20 [Gemmatimonadota bacterium]